jgi:hypothetical protein
MVDRFVPGRGYFAFTSCPLVPYCVWLPCLPLTNSCYCFLFNRLPVVLLGISHRPVPRTGSALPRRPT